MTDEANQYSRREVLKGGLAAPLALATSSVAASAKTESLIQQENKHLGTTDWQLTRVRINAGSYRTTLIEGYCSHQSITAGETLSIYVSTDPIRRFAIDIYRMGYYGGAGHVI